jgi:hypothetical protein
MRLTDVVTVNLFFPIARLSFAPFSSIARVDVGFWPASNPITPGG